MSTRPNARATSTPVDSSGNLVAVMDKLYAVGWRSVGRPRQWVWSVFPVVGSGGSCSARLCGVLRWRVYGTRVAVDGDGRLDAVLGPPGWPRGSRRADRTDAGAEARGSGACPRRDNGHLWRLDRERSTTDIVGWCRHECRSRRNARIRLLAGVPREAKCRGGGVVP